MNIIADSRIPSPRASYRPFTNQDWTEVLGYLAQVIGPEAERYAEVPAAKITAAISYLAGSEDPDRFAVSNLLTFHGAVKARELFNHRPSDDEDLYRRLGAFHCGKRSDPNMVEYGLAVLGYISLADHKNDAAADREAGKYNPLNSKKWDGEALRAGLETQLDAQPALKQTFAALVDLQLHELGAWT